MLRMPMPVCRNLVTPTLVQNVGCTTAMMDEDYLVIGAHIDETLQSKIVKGEYIDFGKLLPRDKVLADDESKLELVIHNGKTFWVPTSETIAISHFSKWEQAFRIYANVYTKRFPHRSSKLIQYNHIIHTIAGMYVWENVYSYDKEFRMHLSKHPNRSWSVILQQAWSMKLKDRLLHRDFQYSGGHNRNSNHSHQGGDKRSGRNSGGGEPCK